MLTQLSEYIAAAFTGIWIRTNEQPEALEEITALAGKNKWKLATWDIARGLRCDGAAIESAGDPVAAIKALNVLADKDGTALLILPNFHRFVDNTEVMQTLAHQVHSGKMTRTFVLILSPLVQIPVELEKQFVVIDHDLPTRQQLREIAAAVATGPGEMPAGAAMEPILDAAAGLTRFEAEGAFALSLVRSGKLVADTIWELKAAQVKKSALLEVYRGTERFADLGGLEALKTFCARVITARRGAVRPKGVLLLGVPGTGKSAFAKALGNEVGRPTLLLDVGAMMGSLVGQSEQNMRQALRLADAMAPCILFVDEIEKALSGVASSGQTDGGTSARVFGTLLTWLSDHATDVFFVGTCNDISKLPPEFIRAERFDGIFFIDLPGDREREKIWPIHRKRYGIAAGDEQPADKDWTGAEIQSCCRLAALLNVPLAEAAANVVPVAVTAAEPMQRLRQWASGRCLDANRTAIYRANHQPETTPAARRVTRAAAV